MLMDTSTVGHFAALSFIVAPPMLTNASALMGLSSSNRLAIAAQRTREPALQLEDAETLSSDEAKRRFEEMSASALYALFTSPWVPSPWPPCFRCSDWPCRPSTLSDWSPARWKSLL